MFIVAASDLIAVRLLDFTISLLKTSRQNRAPKEITPRLRFDRDRHACPLPSRSMTLRQSGLCAIGKPACSGKTEITRVGKLSLPDHGSAAPLHSENYFRGVLALKARDCELAKERACFVPNGRLSVRPAASMWRLSKSR